MFEAYHGESPVKFANHFKYITKIRLLLLGAGELGMRFYDLNQKSRTRIFTQDDLEEVIQEWKGRDWVQDFIIKDPFTKRKQRIVRATTLLRDQWSNLRIEGELATDPVASDEDALQRETSSLEE